ncbi:hypothetical protein ACMBCM_07715, partial [Spiroplasma sp. K1]
MLITLVSNCIYWYSFIYIYIYIYGRVYIFELSNSPEYPQIMILSNYRINDKLKLNRKHQEP